MKNYTYPAWMAHVPWPATLQHLYTAASLLLMLLCATPHTQAQAFAEAGTGLVIPAMKAAPGINAGYRMGDVELSAAALCHPAYSYNVGAVAWYRFPGTHVVDDEQSGVLIGAGYGYSWLSSQAIKDGGSHYPGLIVSVKRTLPTNLNLGANLQLPMVVELRYQARIVTLQLSIRLQGSRKNQY